MLSFRARGRAPARGAWALFACAALGCALDRVGIEGDAAVCDGCWIDGECMPALTRRDDGCGICDPGRAGDGWSSLCDESTVDDAFAELRLGTSPDHGADLVVTARGTVRPIHERDLDGDGYPDLVITQYRDGATFVAGTLIHAGGPDRVAPERLRILPTTGATAAAIADLDDDGAAELIVAQMPGDSIVFRGAPGGVDASSPGTFPGTHGMYGVAVADLDRDGWLDVVLSRLIDGTAWSSRSFVYYGSASGLTRSTDLPTLGAFAVGIGDLDGDGWLDLVFASHHDGFSYRQSSRVYPGAETGFDAARVVLLPTIGATDVELADVDRDGHLEALFGQYSDGGSVRQPLRVYRGSRTGLDPARFFELAASGTLSLSIADANRDGSFDLLYASHFDDVTRFATTSRLLMGGAGGIGLSGTLDYPTVGPHGSDLIDLDGDGAPEAVLPSFTDGGRYDLGVAVHRGSAAGPVRDGPIVLPSRGAFIGVSRGPGSILDRSERWTFESRVHVLDEAGVRGGRISIEAEVPEHTHLEVQIRSADDAAALAEARWLGPFGTETSSYDHEGGPIPAVHDGHRLWQWRATLRRDRPVHGPVLDRVEISFGPAAAD